MNRTKSAQSIRLQQTLIRNAPYMFNNFKTMLLLEDIYIDNNGTFYIPTSTKII